MGGCVSVSISCDEAVNHVCNCLCYIHNLEENLEALSNAVEELRQRRDDVLNSVGVEEAKGLKRLARVQGWLSRVETIQPQVDDLLSARAAESQRRCLCGYLPKNFMLSYCLGGKVLKKLRQVEDLISKGNFDTVASYAPKVDERPIIQRSLIGRQEMLQTAWNHLMDDTVSILGLYGMGGVGKTTLLDQINNKFLHTINGFDLVIWIGVSRNPQLEKIQESIGKRLGLHFGEWTVKAQDEKASHIYRALKQRRFVLLLDDIWTEVDLTKIGVPYPSMLNGSKLVLTTRSKDVCAKMMVDVEMEVGCMALNEAWDLFRTKVGETTLRSDPGIPELARIVAYKCHGLPLALDVIGKAMAGKRTIQEWRHAIDVLTSSPAQFSGMEDEILHILRFSYDNLTDERSKLCFQYCALFPEDYKIEKKELVEYWVGEGIIDGKEDRYRVENHGYEIIGKLVCACLLMDQDDGSVKMHDVIREMALWIASEFGKHKGNFVVKTGLQSTRVPTIESGEVARRISLMDNQIKKMEVRFDCPELTTLFLQHNKLVNISGEFFGSTPSLVVLDLSMNISLSELPEEISELVCLQYLNVSHSMIKRLPEGVKELRKLLHLNLEYTWMLQSVDVIPSLLSLQVLRLLGSNCSVNISFLEGIRCFEHLRILTLTLKHGYVLERFISIHRLASSTQDLSLCQCTSAGISFWAMSGSLCDLLFRDCNIPEIEIEWTSLSGSPCFQSLSQVNIFNCKGLRDLTWLLFAPRLVHLHVENSQQTEEIISRDKSRSVAANELMPFLKLERLYLQGLDELSSIHWSPLPFPCLKEFVVAKCPKLTKLPLNLESAKGSNLVIYGDLGLIRRLDWEDDATRQRFCRI